MVIDTITGIDIITRIDTKPKEAAPATDKKPCYQGCGENWWPGHRCPNAVTANLISERENMIDSLTNKVKALEAGNQPNIVSLMAEKEVETRRLLKLNGLLNGHEIDCIIDTGATNSILSSITAKRLNIQLSDDITTVTLADGTSTQAHSTIEVDFSLASKNNKQTFLITELNAGDALIGLDWLTKYDISIHPTKRTLTFSPPLNKPESDLEKNLTSNDLEILQEEVTAFCSAAQGIRPSQGDEDMFDIDDALAEDISWPDQKENTFYSAADLQDSDKEKLATFLNEYKNVSQEAKMN
jgi:predicted aspartyl protease